MSKFFIILTSLFISFQSFASSGEFLIERNNNNKVEIESEKVIFGSQDDMVNYFYKPLNLNIDQYLTLIASQLDIEYKKDDDCKDQPIGSIMPTSEGSIVQDIALFLDNNQNHKVDINLEEKFILLTCFKK